MEQGNQCCHIQLIDQKGTLKFPEFEKFHKDLKLADCQLSYTVVSIMGPQSSGKSTLLNLIFGTTFMEMDAWEGRLKTTNGIWLARGDIIEPCTLIMDLEGTDGIESQGDTTFGKQSALFIFHISDVVLINMWYNSIGCDQAANMPLLETLFQEVVRLFEPRKTTLMFVLRDSTKHEKLRKLARKALNEDIEKIWNSISKPEAHMRTPLSDFFNIEFVFLSNYEEKEVQFKEEVASLRQRFHHSIAPGGLAGDRRDVIPGSGFSDHVQLTWKGIKENKALNLPAHRIMVANILCEQIAKEKFESFDANEEWRQVRENVRTQPVLGFGKMVSGMITTCLSKYDADATYYDQEVKSAKRKELEDKLLQNVHPVYQSMLGYIKSETLDKFKQAFDKAVKKGGEAIAVAARDCHHYSMNLFDRECEDASIEQANWKEESSEVCAGLISPMTDHILAVLKKKLKKKAKHDRWCRKDKILKAFSFTTSVVVPVLLFGIEMAIFNAPVLSGHLLHASISHHWAFHAVVEFGTGTIAVRNVGGAALEAAIEGVGVRAGDGVGDGVGAGAEVTLAEEIANLIVELFEERGNVGEEE